MWWENCDNSSSINPRDRLMSAHVEFSVAGWWAGVLHPMENPDHLITLLLVGLLGGLAVRAARSSFTLPITFLIGLLGFGTIGLAADRRFDLDPVLVTLSVVLAALLFVHPRHLGVVAPAVVFASGALHGLAHSGDASTHTRSLGYIAGFVFTCCLLLTVGSIVGAAIGRSQRSHDTPPAQQPAAAYDDRALV
jgi:urease accessory protein